MVFGIKIIKILCKQKHMVNMVGNNRQTSSNKMSKFNWTNELVNDLMIYGRTFSRSILNVSLLILIFLYSSISSALAVVL
jgi:hypothetical protein